MISLTDFPTKLIEGNLAFGRDGSVWAYYEIEGFDYDFRDLDQQKVPFFSQMTFLTKNAFDLHYLLIPYKIDGTDVIDKTIADVERKDYALKNHGLKYLRTLKRAIGQNSQTNNSNQYHGYLGVQLDPRKNRYREGNPGTHLVSGVKAFLEGLAAPVRTAVGLDPYDVLQSEVDAWSEQARSIEEEIGAAFNSPARAVTAAEILFITEYGMSLGVETGAGAVPVLSEKVSGKTDEGEIDAIRPNKEAFYELQDVIVDPSVSGRTLKLTKVIDDEEKEMLVRYLVVDSMQAINQHPGFEWLYGLQNSLTFPIGVSIRACHKPNKLIRKDLSNARLGFDDQRKEAREAGTDMDQSVKTSERGAIQMEEVFQKSGHPGYACSFVIRVTAETENELKIRCNQVRTKLDKYGISVKSPYGDMMRYFFEFIPGSKREVEDYWQVVSPGVLAAMLFGATTNIGDNRGFLIGFTKKLKKPVFLQPDLAAKNFAGVRNLFDSLAVMVAGETGKGKSVFMNLFASLSALTVGSQVLIIDPKGDRKKWIDGLPFIPKEFISVWTLGENPDDAGSLDPFRTSTNLREAKDIWMDVASHVTGIGLENDKYALLSDAVEAAAEHKDPCGQVIMDHLTNLYENPPEFLSEARRRDLESLIGALETVQRNQLANLLFGKVGQNYRTLNVNKPIQVLMVQNLMLPGKNKKSTRPAEKISEAILISLTAFTKQFIFKTERSAHKIILQDEAKSIERSEMGRELIDWIERNGRYYNSSLLKGTQNASDYEDATNIGMKASFMLRDPEQAATLLKYYNLPVTPNNVSILQNLERGECLFQDIYGRSAVISINTIFQDFLDAFDTSTANKTERAQEEKRAVEV